MTRLISVVSCVLVTTLVVPAVATASHLGPPPSGTPSAEAGAPPSSAPPSAESGAPPSSAPPTAPPTESPPPPPPALEPDAPEPEPDGSVPQTAMAAKTDTLYLTGREIAVPVACRESGRVTLRRATDDSRVGSAYAECVGYSAVAKVQLKRKVAKALRRALKKKRSLGLQATFVLSSQTLVSRLKLQRRSERSAPLQTRTFQTRTGDVFSTGWLSCGRSTNLSGPGLRLYVPGTSANGGRAAFNEFYNDTAGDNWVWYQPYIYEYGHGWVWSGEWRGPIYVPPYSTMFAATGEGDFLGNAEEYPSYLAGAAYVWWWNGYKDWNWVVADSPYFGYPTHGDYWCQIS